MKKLIGLVSMVSLFTLSAKAVIVCEAKTSLGDVAVVEIRQNSVRITNSYTNQPTLYRNLVTVDGVMTGPGFAFTYDNDYGCVHNATIIARFGPVGSSTEAINVGACKGGSTPDRICGLK